MDIREKTEVHFKSKKIVTTDNPIIYTGNYLLISSKQVTKLGETTIITAQTSPYHLDEIEKIITNNIAKQYKQYEKNKDV